MLYLVHKNKILGEIYPQIASLKTREFRGILIPSDIFYEYRSILNKYDEIFNVKQTSNLIDISLNVLLKIKYKKIKTFYSDIGIMYDKIKISDAETEIRIIDNLIKTGLGNPIIFIESWKLKTDELPIKFEQYNIEFVHPSSPNHIIEVKKNGETLFEY